MAPHQIQYVSDEEGNAVAVIVPIELWREIASQRETAYLLNSEAMKRRLLDSLASDESIPLDDVRRRFNI
jgi:PHD/YefM family antitoxin component YafN of YafNO toxin-antitoxin module